MKAGDGDPRWPAREGEDLEAYLRRLAGALGRTVVSVPLKPMPSDNRMPYRDAGEDREEDR